MLLHIKSLDPDLFKIIESTLKQMGFSKVVDVFFFPPPPYHLEIKGKPQVFCDL